ncbi:hypothetical protein MMYC01_210568 [Madurella mycetomatis]|uniref:Uncharacterized protein n=1 Tax=Madurella mycetomatis TaxID=100816 RepID=A0A175VPK4_9PEZI|nr:hypothetical protein MMYC01_210568 [Madurella mycetomatis]
MENRRPGNGRLAKFPYEWSVKDRSLVSSDAYSGTKPHRRPNTYIKRGSPGHGVSFWGPRVLPRPADQHPTIRSNALTKSSTERPYGSIAKTTSAAGKFNSTPGFPHARHKNDGNDDGNNDDDDDDDDDDTAAAGQVQLCSSSRGLQMAVPNID